MGFVGAKVISKGYFYKSECKIKPTINSPNGKNVHLYL